MLLLWAAALPSWAYQFSYQILNDYTTEPLIPKIEGNKEVYLTTINGKEYVIAKNDRAVARHMGCKSRQ